jgi:hypothetical protein
MPTRRTFNLTAASFAASLAMPAVRAAAKSLESHLGSLLPQAFTGLLHSVGGDGKRHPSAPRNSRDPLGVLTSIDLKARRVRQTPIPIRDAHSAVGLGDGRVLCMPQQGERCVVVDAAHNIMHVLQAPPQYQFFGHALVRPAGQNTIVLTLKRIDFANVADHGLLAIYDYGTLKLVGSVTSGGLNPHEITPIPGTDEVCAVHYGHISKKDAVRVRNVKEPKLSIFDGKTLAIKREYPLKDIAAAMSHLRVDAARNAYCVLQQYVRIGEDARTKTAADRLARYYDYCAEIIGRPVKFEKNPEVGPGEHPVPLPTLKIDTQTGAREIVMTADDYHLAVQSVEVNSLTQAMVASYTASNTLLLRYPDKAPVALKGGSMKLQNVRGVADIPGTPYVIAASSGLGVAAIDVRDGSLVGTAPVEFYEAPHMYFAKV